jgi:hypothetical protein
MNLFVQLLGFGFDLPKQPLGGRPITYLVDWLQGTEFRVCNVHSWQTGLDEKSGAEAPQCSLKADSTFCSGLARANSVLAASYSRHYKLAPVVQVAL